MEGAFSPNNIVIRIINRIGDLVVVHLLWALCSIPIFTIGASTTALHYTAMKSVKLEDGYVAKRFFKSFKENFKQSTLMWLLAIFLGAFFSADLYLSHYYSVKPLKIFFVIVLCVYVFTMFYLFPLQARFANPIKVTIRNAFLLSIKYFPWTLLLILYTLVFALVIYISPIMQMIMLIAGAGCYSYVTAFIYNKIFAPYLPEERSLNDEDLKMDVGANDEAETRDDVSSEAGSAEGGSDAVQGGTATKDTSTKNTPPRKTTIAEKLAKANEISEEK